MNDINFVNLHSHTCFSPFDGLGYPEDHIEAIIENGGDAYCITEHGHMNSLPYQVEAIEKYRSQGHDIKPLYGVESYFIPSLKEWKELYEAKQTSSGDDEKNATVIEDEVRDLESKIKERRHFPLIAKNQNGLENLFELISESYTDENFYYFPRIDYKMLEENADDLIALSGCLGGFLATTFWEYQDENDDFILSKMSNHVERAIDIFGKDDFFMELQWNAEEEQHKVNKYVIELAKKYNLDLVSTADSHYPSKDMWKDREIYQKLGWLADSDPEELRESMPDSENDLKCQLYQKNGNQMWKAYKKYSEQMGVEYDDELVKESIERTHDIAHNKVDDFYPDDSVKLPDFVVPNDKKASEELKRKCVEGLIEKGLDGKEQYEERLKHEIDVIEERNFSQYFLTMKSIIEKSKEVCLTGPARGSGGGSLVNYLLDITQVDPIENGLLFERFLRKDQDDYPDIDTDFARNDKMKEYLKEEWGEYSVVSISNWNTLRLRSLIKDVSKFYGVSFEEVNEVTKVMMHEARGPAKKDHGIKAGHYTPTYEEVRKYSETFQDFIDKYPEVEEHVENLMGQIKSCFTKNVNILTKDGHKSVDELEPNDEIAFLNEFGKIEYNSDFEIHSKGKKEIFSIELENNKTLELTGDHRVKTTKGYKKVKDLNCKDEIIGV